MLRQFCAVLVLAAVSACGGTPTRPDPAPAPGPGPGPGPPPPPPPLSGGVETLVGAGDIGWCGERGAELTASLLDGIGGTVITLGYLAAPADDAIDVYYVGTDQRTIFGPMGPARVTATGMTPPPGVSERAWRELRGAASIVIRALMMGA